MLAVWLVRLGSGWGNKIPTRIILGCVAYMVRWVTFRSLTVYIQHFRGGICTQLLAITAHMVIHPLKWPFFLVCPVSRSASLLKKPYNKNFCITKLSLSWVTAFIWISNILLVIAYAASPATCFDRMYIFMWKIEKKTGKIKKFYMPTTALRTIKIGKTIRQ